MVVNIHISGIATQADQDNARRALEKSGLETLLGDFKLTWQSRYEGGTITATITGVNGVGTEVKKDIEETINDAIGNYGRKRLVHFAPNSFAEVEKSIGSSL